MPDHLFEKRRRALPSVRFIVRRDRVLEVDDQRIRALVMAFSSFFALSAGTNSSDRMESIVSSRSRWWGITECTLPAGSRQWE